MPRFIVWVLIVPFSWFFVQFILAISAVLTVGVLTLPYDSFKENALLNDALTDSKLWETKICTDVIIYFSSDRPEGSVDLAAWDNALSENIVCAWEGSQLSLEELFSTEWDGLDNTIFWVISLYTYWVLEVQNLDTLAWSNLSFVKWMADLIFKVIFDLLFVVIYLLLMIALFLALLTRWIRLWIYAMLSPVFWLLYFFKSEGVWEWDGKFSIKEFISLAMVPVYVAAALAFGLIFILVAGQWIKNEVSPDNYDKLEAWGFSLEIQWALGGEESTVENSVIWKLIVQLFWVVILWIAVMAALRQSEVTKQITQPIADFWKSIWDLAKKAPTYAPIIPTGWWPGSALSISWLSQAWRSIKSGIENEATQRWSAFASRLGESWWWDIQLTSSSQQARNTLSNNGLTWTASFDAFRRALSEWESAEALSRNREFKDLLKELLEQTWNGDTVNVDGWAREIARAIGILDWYAFSERKGEVIPGDRYTANNILSINDLNSFLSWETSTDEPTWSTSEPDQTTNNITINGVRGWEFTSTQAAGQSFAGEQENGAVRFADRNALNTFLTSLQDNWGLDDDQIREILDAFDTTRST